MNHLAEMSHSIGKRKSHKSVMRPGLRLRHNAPLSLLAQCLDSEEHFRKTFSTLLDIDNLSVILSRLKIKVIDSKISFKPFLTDFLSFLSDLGNAGIVAYAL